MLEVKRLSPDLKPDFYRVHNDSSCGGWCFCAAWYISDWEGFGDRTAAQNRQVREDLFAKGILDGYLVYMEGNPVGWCQVGPRDNLPKLTEQFLLEPDPTIWAISCMALAPNVQGKGFAHEIIKLILDDLRQQGIKRVQAFPKNGENLSKETIWTGPISVFLKNGFKVLKTKGHRPVLEIKL